MIRLITALITALRTLTCLPVRGPEALRRPDAIPAFAPVGLLIGLAAGLPAWAIAEWLRWPNGGAFVAVAVGFALTRGLHADGLADACDAIAPCRDREKMLAILKDPHTGAFGVLALVLAALGAWVGWQQLLLCGQWTWGVAAVVAGRLAMAELACTCPPATPEGSGAAIVTGVTPAHRLGSWLLAAICLVSLGLMPVVLMLPALLIAFLVGRCCRRRLGGLTGDLLGATCLLAETACLLAGGAMAESLLHLRLQGITLF